MSLSVTSHTFILCATEGEHGTDLLLVRRLLIQKRVDGRPVQGVIPNWAGQWGVIAASSAQSQTIYTTLYSPKHCVSWYRYSMTDCWAKARLSIASIMVRWCKLSIASRNEKITMTTLQISDKQMTAFEQSMLKEFRIFMLNELHQSAQDVFAAQTDDEILAYIGQEEKGTGK